MRTAPFLFSNMAMLPDSARAAAAFLGGGIARGIEQKGAQVAQAGRDIAVRTAKKIPVTGVTQGGQAVAAIKLGADPIGGRVGQFLENIGGQAQQFGRSVGTKQGMKKRDVGLAAAGAAMTGAFVGGMGANAGIHSLMGYQLSDPRTSVQGDTPRYGGNVMPADLQSSYIALNQLGSPLGMQMMRQTYDVKAAQQRQGLLRAAMTGMMGGMAEEGEQG